MGQAESSIIENLTVSSGYLKEKIMFCTTSVKPRSINESISINIINNFDLIPEFDKQISRIPFKGYPESPDKPVIKQVKLNSSKKLPINDLQSILKKTMKSSSKKLKYLTDTFYSTDVYVNKAKNNHIEKVATESDFKLKKTKSTPDLDHMEFIEEDSLKINNTKLRKNENVNEESSELVTDEIPIKDDYFENSDLKNMVKNQEILNYGIVRKNIQKEIENDIITSYGNNVNIQDVSEKMYEKSDKPSKSDKFFMFTILEEIGKGGVCDYVYKHFDENVRYNYEYNQFAKKEFNPNTFLTNCFLRMDYLISQEEKEQFSRKNSFNESDDNIFSKELGLNKDQVKEVEMIYDIINNQDKNSIYPYDSGCYILSCLIIEDKHLEEAKINNSKLEEDLEFINTIPRYTDISDSINLDHNFDSKTESLRTANDDKKLNMNSNVKKSINAKYTLIISNLGINEIYLQYNTSNASNSININDNGNCVGNERKIYGFKDLESSKDKHDTNPDVNSYKINESKSIFTDSHNCKNIKEENRIYMAGGFVKDYKVNGILEGTRCLGYFDLKKNINITIDKQIVTAIPEILKISLDKDIEFIIMASSSLLKLIDYRELMNFIMNKIKWYRNKILFKKNSKSSKSLLSEKKKQSSKQLKTTLDFEDDTSETVFSTVISYKDHDNFKKYLEIICKEIFEIIASETFDNQDKESNNANNTNNANNANNVKNVNYQYNTNTNINTNKNINTNTNVNKNLDDDLIKSIRESITNKRRSKDDKISLYDNCVLTIIFINFNNI